MDFDDAGREDLIKTYEDDVLHKVIGKAKDYEVTRYRHLDNMDAALGVPDPSPPIYYKFYFYDPTLALPPTTPASYTTSFEQLGFTRMEMYQNTKTFKKSFFKLDFYDSPNRSDQTLYMSLILNATMSDKQVMNAVDFNNDGTPDASVINPNTGAVVIDTQRDVNVPSYHLTYKDEGYFIHWLKEKKLLDIPVFYMSAKFYNGKDGRITKFTNTNPAPLIPTTNPGSSFYYKTSINQTNYTYEVDLSGSRVGLTPTTPIEFYEWTTA